MPAELATKAHPESAAAFFTLGRVQTVRNQSDAAITAFKETLRLNPRASGAQVALARLHLARGNADESVGYAQEAVTASPENPEARLALVRALACEGRSEAGRYRAGEALDGLPRRAGRADSEAAFFSGASADMAGARAEFEAALKSDPEFG